MTSTPAAHVVLLIANDVTADSRVLRYARALASFGLRVTLLGISSTEERTEAYVDGAHVIRMPVVTTIRDARARALPRRLASAWRVGYLSRGDAVAARNRWWVASRDLAAEDGRDTTSRSAGGPGPGVRVEQVRRGVLRRALRVQRRWIWLREGLLNRRLRRRSKGHVRGPARAALLRTYLSVPGTARWQSVAPELLDYEVVIGPELDRLAPDVIHVHDVYLMGVADRAVARARLAGRDCAWVYDAREYVAGLPNPPARTVAGYADHEAAYIRGAARVVTVCEPIAQALQRRFDLPRRPDLVLNAPIVEHAAPGEPAPSVRATAGVGADAPLLVYSGGLARPRGVHTVVEALPRLPGVHLAIVSRGASSYTVELEKLAGKLGVADRVHLVPFVDTHLVVDYLRSATAGVIPLLHEGLNHDWALTNKFFEYAQAGLPIITSDVQVQTKLVREHRIGEAFVAGDPADLARVVTAVLADLDGLRARLADPQLRHAFSWAAQAEVLRELYRDLLGRLPTDPVPETAAAGSGPVGSGRPVALALGPDDASGQGRGWAAAVREHLGVPASCLRLRESDEPEPAEAWDEVVGAADWADPGWRAARRASVAAGASHVLIQHGSAFLGADPDRRGEPLLADLVDLADLGLAVGLVFSGWQVRRADRHAERVARSGLVYLSGSDTRRLAAEVDRTQRAVAALRERFGPTAPVFVSDPDAVADLDGAIWLPPVLEGLRFEGETAPVLTGARPVVGHAAADPALAGTAVIEAALGALAEAGRIDYRRLPVGPSGVPAQALAGVDVLVEQVGLGGYGLPAAQALAAGRLVLGEVGDAARGLLPEDLPIVEVTSLTLTDRLERALADPQRARDTAGLGRNWARTVHGGKMSAAVLAPFLGRADEPSPRPDPGWST